MNNELLLLSKNDIPFIEAQISVHQPTISEIAFIGEEVFFSGCQFLNFSKDILNIPDKTGLEEASDFDIFMSIMSSHEALEYKNNALMVLTLLFPDYQIKVQEKEILFLGDKGISRINDLNFDIFKDILVSMFDLKDLGSDDGYNPVGKRAEKIAEKLQKAKNRKMQSQGNSKIAMLSRYISILSVGEQKDMNDFLQYTVFQLKDEFKRYQMKQSFDIYMSAKMAGATDLDEVDNWMDDIHS